VARAELFSEVRMLKKSLIWMFLILSSCGVKHAWFVTDGGSSNVQIGTQNNIIPTDILSDKVPVLRRLVIGGVDSSSMMLLQPTFSTAGTPAPKVYAYIGFDGTISLNGKEVVNYIGEPADVSSTDYKFTDLEPVTSYRIIVVAQNSKGYSVRQLVQATTKVALLPPALDDLIIDDVGASFIILRQPTFSGPQGIVINYIGIDGVISVTGDTVNNYLSIPIVGTLTGYTFKNLSIGTNYRIITVAENEGGYSVKQILQSTTECTAPFFMDAGLQKAVQEALDTTTGVVCNEDLGLVVALSASSHGISDLTGVSALTNLITADLGDNKITDVGELGQLIHVTDLRLYSNKIKDVSSLKTLVNLTLLTLYDNQITGISDLGELVNLTLLNLGFNQITDVSELGKLTNLTGLYLLANKIKDISSLRTLTKLTQLNIGCNNINSLSGVETLTNLTYLDATYNQINEISELSNLTNLTDLRLESNKITNIDPLGALTNLTYLYLSFNQISDVSGLRNLINLIGLGVDHNNIVDASSLGTLTKLTGLGLNDNQIMDISGLGTLTNLVGLQLYDNKITDISALATLNKLTTVTLDHNQIVHIDALMTNFESGGLVGTGIPIYFNLLDSQALINAQTLLNGGVNIRVAW